MHKSLEEVKSIVLCFVIVLLFAGSFFLNLLFLWQSIDAWGRLGRCFPFILYQRLICTMIVLLFLRNGFLLLLSIPGISASSFWETEHAFIRRLGVFASIHISLLLVSCVRFSMLLESGRVRNKAISVGLFVGVERGFSVAAFVR